jgi:nucleoside-diphosphate-sugar epimerase
VTRAVFVTGGTGYVGRRVVAALLAGGWHVRALTRRRGGRFGGHAQAVIGDLADVSRWAPHLAVCEAVVHCARSTSPDAGQRGDEDVSHAAALWRAAREAGVRRFTCLSTISVYVRPDEGTIDESFPYTDADDPYAQSKVAIERALLAEPSGPELGILQPGCVYGAREGWWSGALLEMMRHGTLLVPDYGRGVANLIHVDDVAAAVLTAVTASAVSGRYIITDGRPVTWAQFYDALESGVGHRATLRLSTDACRAQAARLQDRRLGARMRRAFVRRLTRQRPIFPPSAAAIADAVSRSIFNPARAAAELGFRASRTFGVDTL